MSIYADHNDVHSLVETDSCWACKCNTYSYYSRLKQIKGYGLGHTQMRNGYGLTIKSSRKILEHLKCSYISAKLRP